MERKEIKMRAETNLLNIKKAKGVFWKAVLRLRGKKVPGTVAGTWETNILLS